MTLLRMIGAGFGILIGIYFVGFLVTGGNLAMYRFWMPQFRDAQREVFERSQSYVQGKISFISRLRAAHATATSDGQRDALRQQILVEADTVHPDDLPVSLRNYIEQLRGTL